MSLFWDASGKLERVERRPASNRRTIAEYTYDAGGNRVRRVLREKTSSSDVQVRTTYYVHDAAGTVVSIYEKNCTEPSDIDGDGVLNANDNCMYTWNPGQSDSDGDGVGDECDLCPGIPNPDNADADRDGVGDACDKCMYYNPNQNDSNSNGIGDVCEAWYAGIDSDGDGMVDRVDPCPNYHNGPVWLDGDGDGIPDDCDNCPSVSNPNQKDEDHDGVGDECETAGGGGCSFVLVEQPIYGIIREGVSLPKDVVIGSLGPDTIYTRRLGEKLYELTDHLGNVRGVVSDRLLSNIVSGAPGQFRADMRRYSNLYPYGMEMPGRYYAGDGYRYGYNGMEQDSSSTGDHYTTYYRQYDARLGRFWSIDPVTHEWESPYAAMGGNPVAMADRSGADPENDSTVQDGPARPKGTLEDPGLRTGDGTAGKPLKHPGALVTAKSDETIAKENYLRSYAGWAVTQAGLRNWHDIQVGSRDYSRASFFQMAVWEVDNLLYIPMSSGADFSQRIQESAIARQVPGTTYIQGLDQTQKEGLSLESGSNIVLGLVEMFPGGKVDDVFEAGEKGAKLILAEGVAEGAASRLVQRTVSVVGTLSRAAEFGIKPYNVLRKELAGKGLQAHHLIKKRFAGRLGVKEHLMAAIAVTAEEHQRFTNEWRALIPYGAGTDNATKESIMEAAREIYKNYPEILEALGL